ncbi:HNH endonuclease [Arthrobacter castelli]|uniref:HNH endonuclease n=1 Tax=Arthrobacter castelli TaxID=271431 RepID=UPI0004082CF8|nr:HNH endonuclease signature motif containing protein [Arthrobacter castelli]
MFHSSASGTGGHSTGVTNGSPATRDSSWVDDVAMVLGDLEPAGGDAELLDRITALEKLKSAAAAAQARATVVYDAARRQAQADAGVRTAKIGEGVAGEIGKARQDSPHAGGQHLGAAKALVAEMPHTLAALTSGVLNEWRATLLVKETACLDASDRSRVDEALAADPRALDGLGNKKLAAMAKKEAYRCDPHSVVRRAAKAASERTVTCRPAPDTMTYVTGLLPVAQGVAVQAALQRVADQLRASGDTRGRGQIMADTLVDRVTRPEHQQDGLPGAAGGAGIEIQLVMTDRTLLAGDHEPAHLQGYGTVPAGWARDVLLGPRNANTDDAGGTGTDSDSGTDTGSGSDRIRQGNVAESDVWIRRLYTAPGTGQLIGMDSTARTFPKGLRRMIIARDQTCRTPYCDAPIRHIDHILAHGVGGQSTENNGQGLCERCNQAKEASGYESRPIPGTRHTVETVTPTGRIYRSTAPPLPGTAKPRTGSAASRTGTARPLRDTPPRPGPAPRSERRPESSTRIVDLRHRGSGRLGPGFVNAR